MSRKDYYNSRTGKRGAGCIPVILVFVLALSLSSCQFEYVDKEKEAILAAAQAQAIIDQSAAAQELEQDAALHALEVEELEAAKAERTAARKVSIWAGEYGKSAAIGLSVAVGGALAVAFAFVGFSTAAAYHKRAQLWAGLIYPDARGFMPLQIVASGGSMVFAIDHNLGSVIRLDVTKEPDRQRIKGLLELQQTNNLTRAAKSPFNKNAGELAEIMPEATPPDSELLRMNVKEMIINQEELKA